MSYNKPLIILCRHGSTAFNSSDGGDGKPQRIRGWIDLPLTDEGRQDGKELAERLKDKPIEEVVSSNLKRAEETAEMVADLHALPVDVTIKLRPWHLGYLQGQEVEKIKPIMDKFVNNENQKVPAGESFATFKQRFLSFLSEMSSKAAKNKKVICLVSHTRCLQLAKAWIAKGAPDDYSIDRKVFDDYSDEIGTGGYLEIEPGETMGPEYKESPDEKDEADQ